MLVFWNILSTKQMNDPFTNWALEYTGNKVIIRVVRP